MCLNCYIERLSVQLQRMMKDLPSDPGEWTWTSR